MSTGNGNGGRYRTPLKNVRGWGSAKTGTEHFIHQRLTATALALLGLWFVWFVVGLVGSDYLTATDAVSRPWNAMLLVGFLAAMFWHAQLQPNRKTLPYQAPATPVKQAQASGPSISDSRPAAMTSAPTARTTPVARCRIEVTIWICQRYTCRCGDRGRWRLLIRWIVSAVRPARVAWLEARRQKSTQRPFFSQSP